MDVTYSLAGVIVVLWILISFVKRLRRSSLAALLPGPPSSSWLAGNLSDIQRPLNSVGDADFAWIDRYGPAIKIRGPFGKDLLHLADPKGLQYVLNTSGYNYPRTNERRALLLFISGPGIVFSEGAQHARHRKVMNPAFSYSALKGFLPTFFRTSEKLSEKWKHLVQEAGSPSTVVNVSDWLARATLDMIGETAMNSQIDSLGNSDTELATVFHNLLADTLAQPTDATIAAQAALNYLPLGVFHIIRRIPLKGIKRLAHYISTTRFIAQGLVSREQEAVKRGQPVGKDVMSILIRANGSEDPKRRLGNDEIYAQLTTLMFAGHETTAASVTWILYEVAKRPDIQRKIRDEIKAIRAIVKSRGDNDFSVMDMESMDFTVATIKETLRFHPIVPWIPRDAGHDDVIPLSIPQRTISGDYVTSIPVNKGQEIIVSLCGYNRLKSVWGTDADQWKPERFLDGYNGAEKIGLGVVANLATFSSGIRNCIGWRFAYVFPRSLAHSAEEASSMLEMQAILIELVENFEFSLPPDVEIIRVYAAAMTPMVKGQVDRGTQMPLIVTPLSFLPPSAEE